MPKSLADSLENTKVSYTQLGASGLRVSIPILGAMSFGTYQSELELDRVRELFVTFSLQLLEV